MLGNQLADSGALLTSKNGGRLRSQPHSLPKQSQHFADLSGAIKAEGLRRAQSPPPE